MTRKVRSWLRERALAHKVERALLAEKPEEPCRISNIQVDLVNGTASMDVELQVPMNYIQMTLTIGEKLSE